jgi:hypothetical protein
MTKEREWVKTIVGKIENSLREFNDDIRVREGMHLPYNCKIQGYIDNQPIYRKPKRFETDILIFEQINEKEFKPRVIIEVKINKISTHSAITYSQKAKAHKIVHPYLRYGILIGNIKDLPGRLLKHGYHFDFMQSWKKFEADKEGWETFIEILKSEYLASLHLEEIFQISKGQTQKKFTALHKQLSIKY